MKIAVEGCAHGELNKIYDTINYIQTKQNIVIDLLICCGDFQSFRDHNDMRSMAAPVKYQEMKDFHEYYSGKRKAPVLTLFIGGNHESANYLWELPYGGWVAENIYYIGYAGVVNFGGFRIGGLSGIYKDKDFYKGHFESPPFNDSTKRSFYHVRSCDVAKLKLLHNNSIDIFLSHDWPRGIYNHGDSNQLMKFKPFLKNEILSNSLGSNAAEELLNVLKPKYWFSGHMHAKFSALVTHSDGNETKFLALDKCLPRRNFLQVIDLGQAEDECVLKYDAAWICVLQSTNNIFSSSSKTTFLTELSEEYIPSDIKIQNLCSTILDFNILPFQKSNGGNNDQTNNFCNKFNIPNPCLQNMSVPISNNEYGSSRQSFNKLVIPKPKLNPSATASSGSSDELTKPSRVQHIETTDDDFSELTNPNVSSNPDEITLSDTSDSSESDNEKNKDSSENFHFNPNMSTMESPFVDLSTVTPFKTPLDVETSKNNLLSSDEKVADQSSTPQPVKRLKLIRRNQNVYSAASDETN